MNWKAFGMFWGGVAVICAINATIVGMMLFFHEVIGLSVAVSAIITVAFGLIAGSLLFAYLERRA